MIIRRPAVFIIAAALAIVLSTLSQIPTAAQTTPTVTIDLNGWEPRPRGADQTLLFSGWGGAGDDGQQYHPAAEWQRLWRNDKLILAYLYGYPPNKRITIDFYAYVGKDAEGGILGSFVASRVLKTGPNGDIWMYIRLGRSSKFDIMGVSFMPRDYFAGLMFPFQYDWQ